MGCSLWNREADTPKTRSTPEMLSAGTARQDFQHMNMSKEAHHAAEWTSLREPPAGTKKSVRFGSKGKELVRPSKKAPELLEKDSKGLFRASAGQEEEGITVLIEQAVYNDESQSTVTNSSGSAYSHSAPTSYKALPPARLPVKMDMFRHRSAPLLQYPSFRTTIVVTANQKQFKITAVLLDSGATTNVISRKLARRLELNDYPFVASMHFSTANVTIEVDPTVQPDFQERKIMVPADLHGPSLVIELTDNAVRNEALRLGETIEQNQERQGAEAAAVSRALQDVDVSRVLQDAMDAAAYR